MKHIMRRAFFILVIIRTCTIAAAPIIENTKLCTVATKETPNNLEKLVKKTPLHYLRLSNGCQHTNALYVALTPSGGPFSGHDMEMILIKGTVFRRIRLCDNCPFSPWHPLTDSPYTKKQHKQRGFFVCPDGTIKFSDKEESELLLDPEKLDTTQ